MRTFVFIVRAHSELMVLLMRNELSSGGVCFLYADNVVRKMLFLLLVLREGMEQTMLDVLPMFA